MKYNLELLQKHYIDTGKVIKQNHPTLPLSIYNYSRECQYNGNWDRYTLACRGLVLDTEGNVIAKPFPKFFNYEEIKDDKYAHCEGCRKSGMINCGYFDECGGWEMRSVIPNENFEVYEKMDGSLGIFFYYDGEWHMATRGSFTSEQAIKGMEIAKRLNYDKICVIGYTYLFEIIYPENRIVVDYGKEERLVLLGVMNKRGEEFPYEEMADEGWDIVMKYKTWGEDWETLKKEISKNNEGYVIRFSGGMRMKIKGDEYVRLHRILTNFSTKDIWELLRNNEQLEPFLERVPDEFDAWVKEVVRDLVVRYENIEKDYYEIYTNLKAQNLDRREFADKATHYRHSNILFSMLDGKSYRDSIWKLLKPKYEKPFKKDEK
jgi:RNA ligase